LAPSPSPQGWCLGLGKFNLWAAAPAVTKQFVLANACALRSATPLVDQSEARSI